MEKARKEQILNRLTGYYDKIKNQVKHGDELLDAVRNCNDFIEANLSDLGKESKKLILHFNSIYKGIEKRQLKNPVKYISKSPSMEDYQREAHEAIYLIKTRVFPLAKDSTGSQ